MGINPQDLEKDLYAVLGVSEGADDKELKKAYRRLAQQYHPDRHPGDKQAEERFKEISHAYDILSDPEKRKQYDEGRRLLRSGVGFSGPFVGSFPEGLFEDLGDVGIFADLFGSAFGTRAGASARRSGRGRGKDVYTDITIDFEEAYFGTVRELTVEAEKPCESCRGSGSATGSAPRSCPECRGSGTVSAYQGAFAFSRTCPRCSGSGKVIENPCPRCGGTGSRPGKVRVKVKIPAGIDDGKTLRVPGKGGVGGPGARDGDLYVRVHVRPHPIFEKRGRDLYLDLPISYPEAALGAEIEIPTMEDPVTIRIPPGTQHGRRFRVKSRGVPGKEGRGDLFVTVRLVVPTRLSGKERKALEEFAATHQASPRPEIDRYLAAMRSEKVAAK